MWKEPDKILKGLLGGIKEPKWDRLQEAWDALEGVEGMASPVTLKDGSLIIKVKNSAYLQILNMKREEIKNSLNKKMSGEIKNIMFRSQ